LQAEGKGLYFHLELPNKKFDTLFGDSVRIQQIIVNLLSNAVKFTDEGGIDFSVDVSSVDTLVDNSKQKYMLKIKVRDTGIGISESNIQFLFEKFTQLDSGINRKYGGTGLGLAITKKLVELMNGKIYINTAYTEGAEFIVEIPVSKTDSPIQNRFAQSNKDSSILKNIRVLVAEDDKTNQFLIANILKKISVDYMLVGDGISAISEVVKSKYDIVLMDINMPKLDGISASWTILNHPKIDPKPIIIAVTADAFQEDRDRCIEAGMKDFLPKPYQKNQIEDLIYQWAGTLKK
jgi:CheY-like chemotaxis protein